MKKLFILSIVILIATATFAQRDRTKRNDTTHHVTVVYDFLSKEDPLKILRWKGKKNSPDTFWDVRKLYYGDKVNFKIRVNPFLYDVKVNGENVFDNAALDTAYQSRLLAFFNNSNSATSITHTAHAEEDVHTVVEPKALVNPTSSNSQNQVKATAEMEVRQANQNPTKAEIDGAKMKAVNERMLKVKNDLDIDVKHLNDVAVKKAAAELYKQKVQELYDKESEIDDSIEKFEDEKILLEKVLLLSFSDYREYKDIINEINSYLAYRIPGDTSNHSDTSAMNLQKLTVSTEFVQRTYQRNILHQLVTLDRIYAELKSIDSLYVITTFSTDSLSYTKHKNRLNEFTDESISQFTQAYTIFLQNLSNPNLFVKSYTPRFATADSFRFQISLVPSVRARGLIGLYKIPVRDTAMQPFTLPVKHFLKLNLSTGLAFLFGGAVPNTYFFDTPKDQLTDSQFVSIKKGRRTAVLVPRIALFTHLYLTNGSWGMPALTLGISTNPADPSETAYMMGGSMIMGHHQRMVLTFGAALANIDHLKARYKEEVDKPHLKKYFQNVDEAGLLEKRLQLGLFFGVSYNF